MQQFLRAAGIARADVVGGSYSGLVAQYFAARYPESVHALLLANSAAPDPQDAGRWRAAAAALNFLPQPVVHAAMRASIRHFLPGTSPIEEFWRTYFAETIPTLSKGAMLARLRLTGAMHAAGGQLRPAPYGGPTLVVHAEADALIPRRQQAALRTIYAHAEHAILPARGHVASLDSAATYIALYREFLCHIPR
jgi:pimeloyl-ACP methyl ester carboxylesterase